MHWIQSFDDVGMTDAASVGGKNASLGEMRRTLTPLGIRTPEGFATTADAYRAFMRSGDLEQGRARRSGEYRHQRHRRVAGGRRSGSIAGIWPYPLPTELIQAVQEGYRRLEER